MDSIRGLKKNTQQFTALFTLPNLGMVRKQLMLKP